MQEAASERERADVLSRQELSSLDAYWRAANYLSVGQIYLLDNPLLREPLKPEHIKPRLLGHWGTTPGLNFIYAHLNRLIKAHDLNVPTRPRPTASTMSSRRPIASGWKRSSPTTSGLRRKVA